MSLQIAIALSTMLALAAATGNSATSTAIYGRHIRDFSYIGNEPAPNYSDGYHNDAFPVKYKDVYGVPEKYWGDDTAACPYHGHRACRSYDAQSILVCKEGAYVSKQCPHGKHCKVIGDSAHCVKDEQYEAFNEYNAYKYEDTWPEKQWPEKQWPEKQWPEKQWPKKEHHKHHEHKHPDHHYHSHGHGHGHSHNHHYPHETYINEYHITNSFTIYPTAASHTYSEYSVEPTYTSTVYATEHEYEWPERTTSEYRNEEVEYPDYSQESSYYQDPQFFAARVSMDNSSPKHFSGTLPPLNSSGALLYDLRPLKRQNDSYEVDGFDTGYRFRLNICGTLSTETDAIGRWFRGDSSGILGKLGDTWPQLRGDKLLLEYTNGDACSNIPQLNQTTIISFVCDRTVNGNGRPVFISEWANCAFIFEWRTPLACSNTLAAGNEQKIETDIDDESNDSNDDSIEQGTSRGAVIFVVVFVVGSIYMLGGFLYNRVLNTSSRLRGLEQLPNYRLWRGIFLAGKYLITSIYNGAMYVIDMASGRRGAIRIDDADYNMRNEIFHSDDEQDYEALRMR
ncbi:Cation-independent mannose-6-phosphate receptor CI-MPR [Coemansia brasiliensis]|uniref:Cation-independent mannose-6-phosphate receptor CI-MPR n=1 Tax=Coemansia brasiliensis TaxID=2650707 RepID=A0A9W8M139_9FUNG|nr:Cation-independent mannose-6-phosphate receptor CI-MPR [Coemansia brasiliensis]